MQRIRFAYFGWRVEFNTTERNHEKLRDFANRIVLAEHGTNPTPSYVEPGLPFPPYVQADVWEGERGWQPYL